jgi:DNA-binding transcriptional LysR family regulator
MNQNEQPQVAASSTNGTGQGSLGRPAAPASRTDRSTVAVTASTLPPPIVKDKRRNLDRREALLNTRPVLDVRRLRVLQAVVETGSVTRAAARLSYTPSAISQQLATLEREAGLALVERAGRGLRPTAAGRLLADHATGVLARLDEAEAALGALRDGRTGRVSVVAFSTAGASLVPIAVRDFRRDHPGVAVDVAVAEPDEAVDRVRSGRCDVGIIVPPGDPATVLADLHSRHLLDDPYRVVLPADHALADRARIRLADLAGEPWIGTASAPGYCQQQVLDACVAAGFTPRYAIEADEYPATQGYAAAGLGVALVPLLALGATAPGAVVRRVDGPEPARRVCAVTRPALLETRAVTALLDAFGSAAAAQVLRS